MTHLNALKFTTVPKSDVYNPTLKRRRRLVERLEEQKLLVADQSYIPVQKRWKKNSDGSRSIVDHYRRIKPWWRVEADGNVILIVRSGLKVIEFEKGKQAIWVGGIDQLKNIIDKLITAINAGELDRLLEVENGLNKTSTAKLKKSA